jgi:hypothetical protein
VHVSMKTPIPALGEWAAAFHARRRDPRVFTRLSCCSSSPSSGVLAAVPTDLMRSKERRAERCISNAGRVLTRGGWFLLLPFASAKR